jgi:hypothetical protein
MASSLRALLVGSWLLAPVMMAQGIISTVPREPQGIYATLLLGPHYNQALAFAGSTPQSPNTTLTPADEIYINYLITLLRNPAISGLAPQVGWAYLNPNSPGPDSANPLPGAYNWSPLDDVFIAVDRWNHKHPDSPPKTIQLIVSAGFNAPLFIADDIDGAVCGLPGSGCGSCDGLFMTAQPAVSHQCGYTTLFWQVEGSPISQEFFPLPWNSVYKTDHETFLKKLNDHVQNLPSGDAFVAIAMAGPTATSAEMILPNSNGQKQAPKVANNKGYLTLPDKVPTISFLDTPTAWNRLIGNYYDETYINSDEPFVLEWKAAIDLYSQIFHGVTLELTTTTDALPDFPEATTATDHYVVAPADFTSDCAKTLQPNAQQCAAVTQVISYFANPTVGVDDAKLTWEAGMTAARDGIDLGTNAVKWLSATTAAGLAPPTPGIPYHLSRMLAGMQFSHSFSLAADLLPEGCPDYSAITNPNPADCSALTPAEGLENVLQRSYFIGTKAGPLFGALPSVTYANWVYQDAPMNFLEIYNTDVLYASGLSNCNMLKIAGNPAAGIPRDTSTCAAIPPLGGTASVLASQAELDLAMKGLSKTVEPATPQ